MYLYAHTLSTCLLLSLCAGGGAALLHASKTLEDIKNKMEVFDQKIGVGIVQTALRVSKQQRSCDVGDTSGSGRCVGIYGLATNGACFFQACMGSKLPASSRI